MTAPVSTALARVEERFGPQTVRSPAEGPGSPRSVIVTLVDVLHVRHPLRPPPASIRDWSGFLGHRTSHAEQGDASEYHVINTVLSERIPFPSFTNSPALSRHLRPPDRS